MLRFFLSIVTILFVTGCNELETMKYDPYPDVTVVLKLKKVTYQENQQGIFTFVHASYSIDHRSDEPLLFEVEKIKVILNGVSNVSAYYDSIASIAPFPRRIVEGKSQYDIYVAFSGALKVTKDIDFKILDCGLTRVMNKRNPLAPFDRSLELPRNLYPLDQKSVQKPKNDEILKTTISGLNIDHPELDVERNIGDKDLRFIGINGYACYTPGVGPDDQSLTERHGVKCLDGTSDVIENEEHFRLTQIARKYARAYNLILLKKLKLMQGI